MISNIMAMPTTLNLLSKPTISNLLLKLMMLKLHNARIDIMLTTSSLDSQAGNAATSALACSSSGLGFKLQSNTLPSEDITENSCTVSQTVLDSLRKGIFDSSWSPLKAVQVKSRHIVSKNRRRYREGEFDLDMSYITENIIAMGFPAGDLSSGLAVFLEGFYCNRMGDVIKFLETYHKRRYKVYNLCSERLYDASLFQGKVASFPFDDHNCPPLQLIKSFCQSAYSWLKEDIENVVVVHCKAGKGRTGLMICSLLLFLKFFLTVEEVISYYNKRRCIDGRALVLPSQIWYLKYFERYLTRFNGEFQPARRCILRGLRLHKCPDWIRPSVTISNHFHVVLHNHGVDPFSTLIGTLSRTSKYDNSCIFLMSGVLFSTTNHPETKNSRPEEFWIKTPKKGIMVFSLPREPSLAEVAGDFKIHFQHRHGEFYCWLNTTMIENRTILGTSDIDGIHKMQEPYPGFKIDLVMIDCEAIETTSKADFDSKGTEDDSGYARNRVSSNSKQDGASISGDNDSLFSDSDCEDLGTSTSSQTPAGAGTEPLVSSHLSDPEAEQIGASKDGIHKESVKNQDPSLINASIDIGNNGVDKSSSVLHIPCTESMSTSDIKEIGADVPVFSFVDEEDHGCE